MASLRRPSPKKKQKTVKARGSAICSLSQKLFILEDEEVPAREVLIRTSDRTKKSGRSAHFWSTFEKQWWFDGPHNLYHWYGEPLRVPGNAHVTGIPHSYDAEACSRAMAVHAIKKCWFAKSLMTKDEATTLKAEMEAMNLEDGSEDNVARAQKASLFVSSLSSRKCTAFINVHERFTTWCELGTFAEVGEREDPHLITEMIMGGIKWKNFPKDVDPKVAELETAAVEGLEEGAIPKEFTLQNAVHKGYVEYDSRGKISYTSAFLLLVPKEQMENWTGVENAKRAEQSNWWNAHSWFEHLGGIVKQEMEKVKECHETRNPRFVSQAQARSMLDPKNFGILEHVLAQETE